MGLILESDIALKAVRAAGKEILKVYREMHGNGSIGRGNKEDGSPICKADRASNITLCTILHKSFPNYGIVSEEKIKPIIPQEMGGPTTTIDSLERAMNNAYSAKYIWFIDPLEGTADFLKRTGDFGVQIGLTHKGTPVLGIYFLPEKDILYFATIDGGAYRKEKDINYRLMASKNSDTSKMILLKSKIHQYPVIDALIRGENIPDNRIREFGSLGLKACRIAEGTGDFFIFPCTAAKPEGCCAPQIILEEAGGKLTDSYGNSIDYRQPITPKIKGVVVSNGVNHDAVLELARKYLI